jgi:hypothetical protein
MPHIAPDCHELARHYNAGDLRSTFISIPPQDALPAPAARDAVVQELLRTQSLRALEKREDRAQFQLKSAKTSVSERQKRGLTWFPVTVVHEDIGFAGKVVLELQRAATPQGLHLFQVGSNASLFAHRPGATEAESLSLQGVTPPGSPPPIDADNSSGSTNFSSAAACTDWRNAYADSMSARTTTESTLDAGYTTAGASQTAKLSISLFRLWGSPYRKG